MNFLGGGERHSSADYRASRARSADPHTASPGLLSSFLLERPGDVRNFVHKSFIGKFVGGIVSKTIGSVPIVGGIASSVFDRIRGAGASTVPQATACPPGFINVGGQCTPRLALPGGTTVSPVIGQFRGPPAAQNGQFVPPTRPQVEIRQSMGLEADPAAGVAVMGRFGAGFEPAVFMSDTRRCGRGAVLGVDGICYNKRDLRNSERFWPRGRRPLLTGGEMRAISTASSAAKKLQRKQKQLEGLGLLKKSASRTRRALPAGHRAQLTHAGSSHD